MAHLRIISSIGVNIGIYVCFAHILKRSNCPQGHTSGAGDLVSEDTPKRSSFMTAGKFLPSSGIFG